MTTLAIRHTWDGVPLPEAAAALVQVLDGGPEALRVRFFAPFHADPAPAGPPGPTPGLWSYEVVELFLAGPGEQYLELELGPFGHHLALRLDGVRRPFDQAMPMRCSTRRCGTTAWSGELVVPRAWLPEGPLRANAYRIHGTGDGRRYFAASPPGGPQPDFHRLDAFRPFTLPGEQADPTAIVAAAALALGCKTPPPPVASADADTWGRALMETLRRGGHAADPTSA